jgi:predicted nucleic acid-binding protein
MIDTFLWIGFLIQKNFDFNDDLLNEGKIKLIISNNRDKTQRHKKQDPNPHTSSAWLNASTKNATILFLSNSS